VNTQPVQLDGPNATFTRTVLLESPDPQNQVRRPSGGCRHRECSAAGQQATSGD